MQRAASSCSRPTTRTRSRSSRDRRGDASRSRGRRLRRPRARRGRCHLRAECADQGPRRRRPHGSAGARRRLGHLRRRARRFARGVLGVLGGTREGCRGQPRRCCSTSSRTSPTRIARRSSSRRSRWSSRERCRGIRARRRGAVARAPRVRAARVQADSATTRSSSRTVSPGCRANRGRVVRGGEERGIAPRSRFRRAGAVAVDTLGLSRIGGGLRRRSRRVRPSHPLLALNPSPAAAVTASVAVGQVITGTGERTDTERMLIPCA